MKRTGAMTLARWAAAVAILVSGVVHFKLWWVNDYRVIHVIGPLFLLNAVAGLVIGVLLAWRAHPLTELAGFGFAVLTLGGFFLSVYVGLFGFQEVLSGSSQLIAGIAEAAAIVLLAPAVTMRGVQLWRYLRRPSAPSTAGPTSHDTVKRG